MTPPSFLPSLRSNPFLGILRGIEASQVAGIVEAASQARVGFLEVTMNTEGAPALIAAMRTRCNGLGIQVGAGTVRTLAELTQALAAGAEFIISPMVSLPIIARCASLGVPCLPGALTPTEIQAAYEAGATCVKVFPVKAMGGPAYVKELRGPFQDIPLLACGGVDPSNAADYFAAGIDAVAFGASVFRAEWLKVGEYGKVATAILKLRDAAGR